MLSRKIELPASEMAQVLELAKGYKLELAFDKISSEENCIAKILYKNTRRDYQSLLRLVQGIHALEIQRIVQATPPVQKLNLHLLKSKKQRT